MSRVVRGNRFPTDTECQAIPRRTSAERIPKSGNGEKIRFLKQKKDSYLVLRETAQNLASYKGENMKDWNAHAIHGMLCLPYVWAQY